MRIFTINTNVSNNSFWIDSYTKKVLVFNDEAFFQDFIAMKIDLLSIFPELKQYKDSCDIFVDFREIMICEVKQTLANILLVYAKDKATKVIAFSLDFVEVNQTILVS